ncbi:MAG: hypothetical protein BGO99_00680 [Nitrosospira sp. 56-18]|nr:MAG: hypothetical protein BGO99_00680 [Nitrosospira sp. 56-18]
MTFHNKSAFAWLVRKIMKSGQRCEKFAGLAMEPGVPHPKSAYRLHSISFAEPCSMPRLVRRHYWR